MNVYLARHGETTWNVAGRYQGRRESELTPLGTAQAAALAAAMRAATNVGRVIAPAPMLRTTASARPAAAALGVALETDARLIEIAHGTWEGRLRDEIAADDAARYEEDPGAATRGTRSFPAARRWRRYASAGAASRARSQATSRPWS